MQLCSGPDHKNNKGGAVCESVMPVNLYVAEILDMIGKGELENIKKGERNEMSKKDVGPKNK